MNDYIHMPDGSRIRWLTPRGNERKDPTIDGKLRVIGRSSIDQWQPPEPPEAA
jgi:hypothetical protein